MLYNKCNLQRRFRRFSRTPTAEGMEDVLTHALRIVNGFIIHSQPSSACAVREDPSQQQTYTWLKMQMKIWKSTAMTRCSDIIYSFKQISVHLDYVRKLTIMGKITYSQSEKDMYVDILSEYVKLLQRVIVAVIASCPETDKGIESSSGASSGSSSQQQHHQCKTISVVSPTTIPTTRIHIHTTKVWSICLHLLKIELSVDQETYGSKFTAGVPNDFFYN